MVVHRVVPLEEVEPEAPRVLDASESVLEFGAVLQGLELAFRGGIIIQDMGPTVRFPHP